MTENCPTCGRPFVPVYGLTKKQSAALRFIVDFLAVNSIPPSFDEIREGIGLKSKSGVHRLIQSLIYRGLIEHLPGRARSITVLGEASQLYAPDTRRLLAGLLRP